MNRATLSRGDLAAAAAVVVIWGFNFVAMKVALRDFTSMQLGAVRYVFAALPMILLVRKPAVPWRWIVAYGLVQGVGQFGLLFLALRLGMTSALASVLQQTQVFFTALLAGAFLHEKLSRPAKVALGLAAMGLGCFAMNLSATGAGSGLTLASLLLNLGAAAMWAVANIFARQLQRRFPGYSPFEFVVWSSLAPIAPFVALSLYFDGAAVWRDWSHVSVGGWVAAAYLGWLATLAAYGLWTGLLARHPANRIAPFSLGVPVVGLVAGILVLGESITLWQGAGVAFVGAALVYLLFGR
ncbi:O-acetylserine/cysteine efflux transporter [Paraburkholderia unamae]|uniref:EamA family transporter n=1 Tax=Paraburkholderia unamae TaxID=219649 RepID=UPI000DC4129E|nr:EamA family transporter [Paraburkholderia unamae]RAR62586.1 O-acetylserine/cysteine efflux transporter [Paraburkholderia unamae]